MIPMHFSPEQHWCKHCDRVFLAKLHEKETGDFFLVCPGCGWRHYRRFEKGVAVHCELSKRESTPIEIRGI